MNEADIKSVQQSFARLLPIAGQVGPPFYAELFAAHPELRPMFAADIAPQAKKLVQMLAVVVRSLHKLDTILPAVHDLARRHRDYGVADEHYAMVGNALMATLQRGLGEAFTPEVKQAWLSTYTALADVMMAAGRTPVAA
jgi:hemoglobin-like flavoprotein